MTHLPLRPAIELLRTVRVGHLATVSESGRPSVVPVCFAVLGEDVPMIASVLDEKPKRLPDRELARVRHIRGNPQVTLVIDHYEEDWAHLWFVQAHGLARLIDQDAREHQQAVVALRQKYPQYRDMNIEHRPVILIEHLRLTGWSADGRPLTG